MAAAAAEGFFLAWDPKKEGLDRPCAGDGAYSSQEEKEKEHDANLFLSF